MDDLSTTLKETAEELLGVMGFDGQVKIEGARESLTVSIITPEGGALIGQGGANLAALQHLLRLMVSKKMRIDDTAENENFLPENKNFTLDVNNYRQDRIETLKDFILDKAGQAARERRTIPLSPMSSYERRIVHMTLKDNPNILCQSEGEGEERHIVIKPV